MTRKNTAPESAPEFLTDQQAAALLGLGATRFFALQKSPDFPPPLWLGPRGKRHVRGELLEFALSKRERATA